MSRTARTGIATFAALVILVSASCGDDPSEPPRPTTVTVAPTAPTLTEGDTETFSATVLDQDGEPMPGEDVAWSTEESAVATIGQDGTLTAVGTGSTTVTATAGAAAGSTTVTVLAAVAEVVVTAADASLFVDQGVAFAASALDDEGGALADRTVSWSSSNADVVTVDAAGEGRAVGAGTARITATVDGVEGSVDVAVAVNPVLATSYLNFTGHGHQPVEIPLGAGSSYFGVNEEAHAFGDFFGRGAGTQDLFTASVVYTPAEPESEAAPAELRFWRNEAGTFVEDNSILTQDVTPCLHPRKALVADYNLDGRPDIFLVCHGFDAAPFPGEPNQVILSEGQGYRLAQASPEVAFWHGGAAMDLNDDGFPDVVAGPVQDAGVFINDGTGSFDWTPSAAVPGSAGYYNLELIDVDEDGDADLLMGGHEWEAPTRIWLNAGQEDFTAGTPITIPPVEGAGVVTAFAVTGSGATRTVWVLRTGGTADFSRFYDYPILQRYDLATGAAEVVLEEESSKWAAFLMAYTREGALYVGSSDLRRPIEYLVP